MNIKDFEENLLLYGAHLSLWPKDLHDDAQKSMQDHAQLQHIHDAFQHFETLAKQRPILADDPDFAMKIINAATTHGKKSMRHARVTWKDSLSQIFQDIMGACPIPHPVYAILVVALCGYLVGAVSAPAPVSVTASVDVFLIEARGII